jgi:hypothetical protein
MAVITYSYKQLYDAWYDLFEKNKWLIGLECTGICENVFCCHIDVPDWGVVDTAQRLLFLLGKDYHVEKISANLEDYEDVK